MSEFEIRDSQIYFQGVVEKVKKLVTFASLFGRNGNKRGSDKGKES